MTRCAALTAFMFRQRFLSDLFKTAALLEFPSAVAEQVITMHFTIDESQSPSTGKSLAIDAQAPVTRPS